MEILSLLANIPDHRDRQGREYRLEHVLLFSILALISNAKYYNDIGIFIAAHFERLKSIFNLKWRGGPHFSAIRKIIVGIDPVDIEKAFETFASSHDKLSQEKSDHVEFERKYICFDGKSLNGSISRTKDKRASHVFQVFVAHSQIILAHLPLDDKESEIGSLCKINSTALAVRKQKSLRALYCLFRRRYNKKGGSVQLLCIVKFLYKYYTL